MSCIRKVRKAKGNTADNSADISLIMVCGTLYAHSRRCPGMQERLSLMLRRTTTSDYRAMADHGTSNSWSSLITLGFRDIDEIKRNK